MIEKLNSPFAKALRDLLDGIDSPLGRKISQKELANAVGVSRQVISQYCNGDTSPNVEKLYNIAKFFNVSSDFLIGLTSTPTTNTEDRMIHEKTGLTDQAISVLKRWNEWNDLTKGQIELSPGVLELKTLNHLLENISSNDIFKCVGIYLFSELITKDNENRINLVNKKNHENIIFTIDDIMDTQLVKVQNICKNLKEAIQKDETEYKKEMSDQQMLNTVKTLNKMMGGEIIEDGNHNTKKE